MPPKRKTAEDTRNPIDVAIDNTTDQIRQCEAQINSFKEGVHDLAVHTQRTKQLEQEIIPKETELKQINLSFQRLLDSAVALHGSKSNPAVAAARGNRASTAAAAADDGESQAQLTGSPSMGAATAATAAPSPMSQRTLSRAMSAPSPSQGQASPQSRQQQAPPQTAPTQQQPQPSEGGADSDREALRHIAAVVRENLASVITPLYHHERTPLEIAREEQKERDAAAERAAAEAAKLLAQQQQQQQEGGGPQQAQQPQGKKGGGASNLPSPQKKGASGQQHGGGDANDPSAALPRIPADRVDPDLYLPPGMDHAFYADLLKLRQSRVSAERALKSLQTQLSTSRQIVARRTNEGASKTALKKAEKVLQGLTAQLRELKKQREDYDAKRRNDPNHNSQAADKKKAKK